MAEPMQDTKGLEIFDEITECPECGAEWERVTTEHRRKHRGTSPCA